MLCFKKKFVRKTNNNKYIVININLNKYNIILIYKNLRLIFVNKIVNNYKLLNFVSIKDIYIFVVLILKLNKHEKNYFNDYGCFCFNFC